MTMPVKMGKTPLINASAEAIVPYRALLTPGTCLRMVLFSGERDDWAKLLPTKVPYSIQYQENLRFESSAMN